MVEKSVAVPVDPVPQDLAGLGGNRKRVQVQSDPLQHPGDGDVERQLALAGAAVLRHLHFNTDTDALVVVVDRNDACTSPVKSAFSENPVPL